MTPKQLRSAAHALRTAANALEEVTTQLRALSTEIDTPDDLNDTEPAAPVWPSAPFVWQDGKVWTRDENGDYNAVRVLPVPAREWGAWRRSAARRECHRTEVELMSATDVMAGW